MDNASIDSLRDANSVSIKWNHFGVYRRFALPLNESDDMYAVLVNKIQAAVPGFQGQLAWQDDDGDEIIFTTAVELEEAIAAMKLGQPLRLYSTNYVTPPVAMSAMETTPVIAAVQTPTPPAAEQPQPAKAQIPQQQTHPGSDKSSDRRLHRNVVCDLCDGSVCGRRFKCLQCADFDLCEGCEATGAHAEHPMIRIVDPNDYAWQAFVRRHHRHHHRHPWGPGGRWAPHCQMPGTRPGPPGGGPRCGGDPFLGLFNNFPRPPMPNQQENANQQQNGGNTQHPDFQANIERGMDFLRDIGAQVHQALANFGIDVDVDVEHHGQKEKVPKPAESGVVPPQATATATPADVVMTEQHTEQPINATTESQTHTTTTTTVSTTTVTASSADQQMQTASAVVNSVAANTEPLPILVRIDDDDEESPVAGGDWTMLHHQAGGQVVQPNTPEAIVVDSPSTGIYPSINVPIQRQHQIYHPDPRVQNTVTHLMDMGFDNDDGWLVRLVEAKRGDINAVLNALSGGGAGNSIA